MAGFKSSQFDSAGLTLSHCAFISQVWLWENHNLGKGVPPHRDTVTITQAKTKTAQWISHDGKDGKRLSMWWWWQWDGWKHNIYTSEKPSALVGHQATALNTKQRL